jgi:phytoene dehydrogenase-like protein
MPKKKAVVIGGGIGGSAIGALLASSGKYEVELFEKTPFIGGRYASYEKHGFKIDVGCHIIANCENGTMGTILKMVGEGDTVKWVYTRRPGPIFFFMGDWVKFPSEVEKLGLPPEEVGKIVQMYADVTSMTDKDVEKLEGMDMMTFLARYTTDPKVSSIFGFLMGLYFVVPPQDIPVSEWIWNHKEMMKYRTSGYPVGGTGMIPEAYAASIRRNGGKVHLKSPTARINVRDGIARGITLADGKTVEADIVLSNAGVKPTVLDMVGESHYPREYSEIIKSLRYTSATFNIKIGLDKPITTEKFILYVDMIDFDAMSKLVLAGEVPDRAPLLMVPIVSNLDPTSAPEGRQLIFAGLGIPYQRVETTIVWNKWKNAVINGLRHIFPGIDEHIMWLEMSSPRFIEGLFGEEGNCVGVAQILSQVGDNRPKIADPYIKNLYHVSADNGLHGIGGELAGDAALRAYEMLK